ncbi:MAG: rod shape-determining protein MreC [Candidatus Magasanikbacteria bacterium]
MRINEKQKTYYYLCFFLIIIIAGHYLGWINWIENGARGLMVPYIAKIQAISHLNRVSSAGHDFTATACSMVDENISAAKIKLLETENTELKKLLDFRDSNKSKWITVAVLGKGLDNTANNIIIAGGDRDAIKVGQPVIAGAGVLVGRIVKTTDNIAIVQLINDSRFNISGLITNKDGSLGIVTGGYGLSLRMELIPRNEVVAVGESVVSGGLESDCPRGLMIGTIAVVENEAYKPFQQAVLTPAMDVKNISAVSVLVAI